MQKGFITPCSHHLLPLLSKIQYDFDHVIFTKFYNPNPSPFREILDYQKLAPGSEDTKLALVPRKDAFIVDRPYYTCVTASLREHLEERNVSEVFICGVATEACVLKTVLDLFEHNIRPWIIEDLCASDQNKHYHDIAIELMAKLVGKDHIIHMRDLIP